MTHLRYDVTALPHLHVDTVGLNEVYSLTMSKDYILDVVE